MALDSTIHSFTHEFVWIEDIICSTIFRIFTLPAAKLISCNNFFEWCYKHTIHDKISEIKHKYNENVTIHEEANQKKKKKLSKWNRKFNKLKNSNQTEATATVARFYLFICLAPRTKM